MWRIIWQVSPSKLGLLSTKPSSIGELISLGAPHFSDILLVGEIEPVFAIPPDLLRTQLLDTYKDRAIEPLYDLTGYFQAYTNDFQSAKKIVARLKEDPNIRYADLQPPLFDPVKFSESRIKVELTYDLFPYSGSPNLFAEQGYLQAAPIGIDAIFAWSLAGGRGDRVKIIDIESGWNFQHEDLRQSAGGVIYGPAGNHDHGTSVLGIYSGDDNNIGVTGIASESYAMAASAVWNSVENKWNAAAAIQVAADKLQPGDIILLEMHAPGPNSSPEDWESQRGFIPIEYWDAEFAAISYAVSKGIYVVEAAGNGGENLDDPIYQNRFDRGYRDSGAILVGGGHSPYSQYPRSRIYWSNYGSRLDVQGWGEHIVTCGGLSEFNYYDRWKGPSASQCYTQSFGGTSGASPLIVGALACISGILKQKRVPAVKPLEIRTVLTNTGLSQADSADFPSAQRIGPLPNIKAILQALHII